MVRKYLIIFLNLTLLTFCVNAQVADSSIIILGSNDTIVVNKNTNYDTNPNDSSKIIIDSNDTRDKKNSLEDSNSSDTSPIILDTKDTIIGNKNSRSLINPKNLEIRQKKYWEDVIDTSNKIEEESNQEKLFKPMVSIGIGSLSFLGDIGDSVDGKLKRYPFQSLVPTYTLRLVNPINEFLDLSFYVMFGRTSIKENDPRPLISNPLIFNTEIRSGGVTVNYNFGQLLKKDHIVEPYIHLGLESIEYLSTIDTVTTSGKPNFTADIDFLSPDDTKNKVAFGIPLEIGAHVHVGNRIKFRVGTAMHFTSSNLIDGINENGTNYVGSKRNDNLLFTHIAIVYDFNSEKKKPYDPMMDDVAMNILLQDTIDSDEDGIVDHVDFCAKTPPNTMVDQYGCPLDDDFDGVTNSFDIELLSMEGAIVNDQGSTMNDEDFLLAYKIYRDSSGEYSEWDTIYNKSFNGPMKFDEVISKNEKVESENKPKKDLFVVVGSDEEGVSSEELWKKLSDKDFQVKESGDSTVYVLGGYNEEELSNKIIELEQDSVEIQGVVEISENQEIVTIQEEEVNEIINSNSKEEYKTKPNKINKNISKDVVPLITPPNNDSPVLRVQIGAFNRRMKKSVFNGMPNVVGIKGDDGLYRFYSGSFTDKFKAAQHKVDLTLSGYNDAFIVAFQKGKRISLKEAGFDVKKNFTENLEVSSTLSGSQINPEKVRFKIQVGAFKEKISESILESYRKLGNVKAVSNLQQGYTKYYMGDFMDYENALKYRKILVENGLIDCFIVGEFQSNIITSKQARDLLGL
ncbi:MAG: SPOR domain-containing protein [Flavobacteriales bacterium]|nr:SPOR domain-containing protein [Flavobacteriales bacterium]